MEGRYIGGGVTRLLAKAPGGQRDLHVASKGSRYGTVREAGEKTSMTIRCGF